ncbi:hypothetical protein ABZ234_03380 [Nocardiopsis sp. NPDC006198]|uniref:hypothetical protein n=1 Tax=Nocardiopsis sp. NPDC006198 TaxID=3154472 RepID=UPI0033B7D880
MSYMLLLTLDVPGHGRVTLKSTFDPAPGSTRMNVLDDAIAYLYRSVGISADTPPVIIHWSLEPMALGGAL